MKAVLYSELSAVNPGRSGWLVRCRPAWKPWRSRFRAFPSWFMRITCDRCGQQRMFSETHAAGQRDMRIRDIIAAARSVGVPQLAPANARNSSNTGPFSAASSILMARAAGPPSITRWSTER